MAESTNSYALITGASRGIGRAFAEGCAARGYDLFLIALPGEDLETVAGEIAAEFGKKVEFMEGDLTADGFAEEVYAYSEEKGINVKILVNNAGFGTHGDFLKTERGLYRKLMEVNMVALHDLTHLFLPGMMDDGGWVVNMGSGAAFMAGVPYKVTYGASKSFVLSFSRGLQQELKHTKVKITCVCPLGVITNEKVRARIQAAGFFSRMSAFEPEEIVDGAFRRRRRRRVLWVPGVINTMVYYIDKFFPAAFSLRMVENTFKRKSE